MCSLSFPLGTLTQSASAEIQKKNATMLEEEGHDNSQDEQGEQEIDELNEEDEEEGKEQEPEGSSSAAKLVAPKPSKLYEHVLHTMLEYCNL